MTLNEEFRQLLQQGIKKHDVLLNLREILVEFKNRGMSKEAMLENLEKIRHMTSSSPSFLYTPYNKFKAQIQRLKPIIKLLVNHQHQTNWKLWSIVWAS